MASGKNVSRFVTLILGGVMLLGGASVALAKQGNDKKAEKRFEKEEKKAAKAGQQSRLKS